MVGFAGSFPSFDIVTSQFNLNVFVFVSLWIFIYVIVAIAEYVVFPSLINLIFFPLTVPSDESLIFKSLNFVLLKSFNVKVSLTLTLLGTATTPLSASSSSPVYMYHSPGFMFFVAVFPLNVQPALANFLIFSTSSENVIVTFTVPSVFSAYLTSANFPSAALTFFDIAIAINTITAHNVNLKTLFIFYPPRV